MASLIISDTHFGLDSSTLKSQKNIDQLMREISEFAGGCDEVILLGDIFDFWRTMPENALRDSLPFLKQLSSMDISIRYVIGNHDHHLVVQKQEAQFMERAARGDLNPVFVPVLRWHKTIAGLDIEMFYPTYKTRCSHRDFLFTHGHHLDGIQTFTLQLVDKLRRIAGEKSILSDREMMMTYTYESIYRSASFGEMVSVEDSLWKASSLLLKFNSCVSSSQRMTSVEGQYEAIRQFICERGLGKVDCFVYGDTHRAGIFQRIGGPLAVNTGCFMREKSELSSLETPDTYLLLDEDGLALRQMGKKKPLYLCELL